MALMEELQKLGVNTDEALSRFMNNAGLYQRMLGKFITNAEKVQVLPFLEAGDLETAQTNAHTLKGVTGNLSLTPLYEGYSDMMVAFRAGEPEKAKQKLLEILPVQEKILDCIRKAQ